MCVCGGGHFTDSDILPALAGGIWDTEPFHLLASFTRCQDSVHQVRGSERKGKTPTEADLVGLKWKRWCVCSRAKRRYPFAKVPGKNVISLWSWSVMRRSSPESLPNSARVCFSRLALSYIWKKKISSRWPHEGRRMCGWWNMPRAISSPVLMSSHLFALPLANSTHSTCPHTLAHFHKCKG